MKRLLIDYGIPLLILALAVGLIASGLLDEKHVFANFDANDMHFAAKKREAVLQDGDTYGILESTGPGYNLDPGVYRLKWSVYADGENAFYLSFDNGARIEPDTLIMPRGEEDGEFTFTVLEPGEGLQVRADFREGTHLALLFLRLYAPPNKSRAVTCLLMAALFAACWIAVRRGGRTCLLPITLMLGVLLLACAPALRGSAGIWEGETGLRQLARVEALADTMQSGALWSRLTLGGLDSALPVFMPELPLLPFALLRRKTTAAYTLNLLFFAVTLASMGVVYAAGKRLLGKRGGLTAALLFAALPFRQEALFRSAALGEILAVCLGLLALVCCYPLGRSRARSAAAGLALGAAFLCCPLIGMIAWTLTLLLLFCGCARREALTALLIAPLLCAPLLYAFISCRALWSAAFLQVQWKPALVTAGCFAAALIAALALERLPEEKHLGALTFLLALLFTLNGPQITRLIRRDGLGENVAMPQGIVFEGFALPTGQAPIAVPWFWFLFPLLALGILLAKGKRRRRVV